MPDQHDAMQSVVDAVQEIGDDLTGPTIPWTMLSVLDRLVPTAEIAFVVMDYRHRRFVSHQCLDDSRKIFVGDTDAAGEQWWSMAAAARTSANPRLSPVGWIERWSGTYSRSEVTSWPLYQEYWRGVGDLLSIEFPSLPGCTRRLLLWRDLPDTFSPGDETLVRLLRPHLFEIDSRARRRRDRASGLTAREWQVLDLVAQGASNAEVATALVTSVATVRKHMEHIFDRSGVRNRSAAVARLMPSRTAESSGLWFG